MNVSRGNIVLIDFPFAGGGPSKVRPALVVQNDRDNRRLQNTIVAMITSRASRSHAESTQVFVERSTHSTTTGLRVDSVVNCINVFTLERSKVLRKLGDLPPELLRDVDQALRVAFGL